MKLASWNVNSIRARVDLVTEWLSREQPDVLCMQETKVVNDEFPTEEFSRLGYSVAMAGQPTYNGVAIASRLSLGEVSVGLPGSAEDAEKRLISARVGGIHVFNVYVPNGKGVLLPSFQYKLQWFERLRLLLDTTANPGEPLLVCGDFNVAREPRDVYDPVRLSGHLHFHPDEHRAFERLCAFGLVDLYRKHHDEGGQYSWWDYRAGALRLNRGLRIDYVLGTESVAARCRSAWIDGETRKSPRPSDHAPVVVEFET